jgi:hypothetical protein
LKAKTYIVSFLCLLGIFISLSKNVSSVLKLKFSFGIESTEDNNRENNNESKEKEFSKEPGLDDFLLQPDFISFDLYISKSNPLINKFIFSSQTPLEKLTPPPKKLG